MDVRAARLVVRVIDEQLDRVRERTSLSRRETTDLLLDLRLTIDDIAHLPWRAIEAATPPAPAPVLRRHERSRRFHFSSH